MTPAPTSDLTIALALCAVALVVLAALALLVLFALLDVAETRCSHLEWENEMLTTRLHKAEAARDLWQNLASAPSGTVTAAHYHNGASGSLLVLHDEGGDAPG